MKLIRYLLFAFGLGVSSAFTCRSRNCRRGDETPLVRSGDESARSLAIPEPNHYVLGVDDDIPSRSDELMKRSLDDENNKKESKPKPKRRPKHVHVFRPSHM